MTLIEEAESKEKSRIEDFPGDLIRVETPEGPQGTSQDNTIVMSDDEVEEYSKSSSGIPSFPNQKSLPEGLRAPLSIPECDLKVSEIGSEISDLKYRFEDTSKYVRDLKKDVSLTLRMLNGPREDGECNNPSHSEILELKNELLAVKIEELKRDADTIMHCVADKFEEIKILLADAEGDSNTRLKIATIESQLNEMDFNATALARESAALENEVVRYREGITNAAIQCEPLDF